MISTFLTLIPVILTAVILRYVLELEKKQCECALKWQHKFIKYFAPVVILVSLIMLLVSPQSVSSALKSNRLLGTLYVVYFTVYLVYVINLVLYFLKLRYSQCECARDWKQYGLLYPVIGFALVLLLLLIVNVLMVFNLLPLIVEKITGKKPTKSATPKELIDNLTVSVKNNARKSKK